jgi:hypothetical protein
VPRNEASCIYSVKEKEKFLSRQSLSLKRQNPFLKIHCPRPTCLHLAKLHRRAWSVIATQRVDFRAISVYHATFARKTGGRQVEACPFLVHRFGGSHHRSQGRLLTGHRRTFDHQGDDFCAPNCIIVRPPSCCQRGRILHSSDIWC